RGNKKKAEKVVLVSASISAMTTISIALASQFKNLTPLFQSIAIILSASLTILVAWDGFYNHKRLWLLQAETVNRLKEINTDIRHLEATGSIKQSTIDQLYIRYKEAFGDFNNQWKELRIDDGSQTNNKKA
ncbi:MAG: SLATT domain-containing protein, partial [Oceanicoccus sp.]|uniref:SLATT domain-containing protein n=1 Tax=Oceanicoccus sp. TaxID=2691044 RepID=UPI00260A6594